MSDRRIIVDHVLFVVEDLDASRRLYTAALARLGYVELHVQDDGVHYGADDLDDFAIYRGSPVTTPRTWRSQRKTAPLWISSSIRPYGTVRRCVANLACGRSTRTGTTRRS